MKKRIGTNEYDTEKAILVLQPDLYRKLKSFVFFRFDGETITPVERDKAETMIKESGDSNAMQFLQYSDKRKRGLGAVGIDFQYLDKLSAYCRRHKVTQKEVIEDFIKSLPDD